MDISARIKAVRKKKGFKQMDMAVRLGMEAPNYNRLENRGDKLSLAQLREIADALNVPLMNLLYDVTEKSIQDIYAELYEKYRSTFNDVILSIEDIVGVQHSIRSLAKKLKIGSVEYTDSKGVRHLLPIRETKFDPMWGGIITTERVEGQHFSLDEQDKEEIRQVVGMIVGSINQDFNDRFYSTEDERTDRNQSTDVDTLQLDNQELKATLFKQQDKNMELAAAKRRLEVENWELKAKLAACMATQEREEELGTKP